jgi:hypothetical protein
MTRIGTLLAGICLLVLAGCGGAEESGGNSTTAGNQTSTAAGGESVQLQPGQWEMSFEMTNVSAPGMPAGAADMMKTPKTTVQSCVSEAEASKPDAGFFGGKENGDCTSQGFSAQGGQISGTMTCKGTGGAGETRVTMEGDYSPTRFNMTSRTEIKGEGLAMTMESRSTGGRLGECPDSAYQEDNLGKKRKAG